MSNKLRSVLKQINDLKRATDTGTKIHNKMRQIVIDQNTMRGAPDLCEKISANPDLLRFFTPKSRTEVPIAGKINGRFISRRLDRIVTDDTTKSVYVLDYKTDISKSKFRQEYVKQIQEYISLLRDIYPSYTIHGYILWLHDFSLDKIV